METKHYLSKTIETIYERRAIRKFKTTEVSKEILNEILNAGRMAPSAMNKQPWKFYVLSSPTTIARFSKAIISESKFTMLKAGVKEAIHHILHPGSFHLKDGIEFMKQEDPIFHGAPLVVFISSPRSSEWAQLDVGMCAQNMMLAAKSLGVDSCPVGLAKFIEQTKEYEAMGIPSSEKIDLALLFGYADEVPVFHERKTDNVTFLD